MKKAKLFNLNKKRELIFYAISGAFLDCILVHFDIALDKNVNA
ncbi:MAG: hypothetical protein AB7E28_07850 [Desulfurella sp.]